MKKISEACSKDVVEIFVPESVALVSVNLF
jgi:hypothetical protein